jgi:hypothetical protein
METKEKNKLLAAVQERILESVALLDEGPLKLKPVFAADFCDYACAQSRRGGLMMAWVMVSNMMDRPSRSQKEPNENLR